ncbi:serine hydrolase domain-containing protein [Flagellimonas sp. 2504JD1-5]
MRRVLLIFHLCFGLFALGHNGKVAYVNAHNIIVDGKFADWKAIGHKVIIGKNPHDFYGTLQFACDYDKQLLSIGFMVNDNHFIPKEVLEIYINAGHYKRAPSNLMLKFEGDQFVLFKHDIFKDPVHAKISKNDVSHKILKSGNQKYYEIQIKLGGYLRPLKTIGFDLLYIDEDKNEDTEYLNWGKGYYGFLKEYNSGQLGDLVLLQKDTELLHLTGNVKWKDKYIQETIDELMFSSKENPDLWVIAAVDSFGNYSVNLPKGEYQISSAYKISNPWASWGEQNQFRIDETKNVEVDLQSNLKANLLELKTFSVPDFLIPKKGILTYKNGLDTNRVDAFVTTYLNYFNVPGASIALIKEGKLAYYKTFGVQSTLTKLPVNKKVVFQAASVTKPVFAFIANRLVDNGILELDKPLHEYLVFKNIEHDPLYEGMTARHVLSHQSGLPNWAWGGPNGWMDGQKTDLLFAPGKGYGYSGEAFQYLGRVVEKITDKNLAQLLQEEVIEPLNIPQLYLNGNDSISMVQGHVQNYPTYYDMVDEPGVAHSLLTEAYNFSYFVNALINREGLSEKQYDAMFHTEVLTGSRTDKLPYWNQGLGLGFFTQDTALGKAIMHGGSNGDFQSEFVIFPKQKMGFVMFTNSNTGHKLGQALGRFLFYGRN